MKMVFPAAPASTTIGKAEALADPAVSAPGVCEVGAGDLFEAGAGGPEPDARLLGGTCVNVGTAVCRCHSAFSTAFVCFAPVRCPFSVDTAFLQRLQNQISYPWGSWPSTIQVLCSGDGWGPRNHDILARGGFRAASTACGGGVGRLSSEPNGGGEQTLPFPPDFAALMYKHNKG